MASIEERVRAVQTRATQARSQRARVEVEHEQALSAAQTARQRLKDEFGVESTDDARTVLTGLQNDLETELAQAESALERTAQ